jgi:plastocyanin
VGNNFFNPSSLTINVGDSVVWQWVGGSVGHNIVCDKPFGSGTADPMCGNFPQIRNSPFSTTPFTYTTAGTYAYYCDPHRFSGMTGTVTVQAVGSPPAISGIPDKLINTNSTTGVLSFIVSDNETAATSLNVSKAVSNGTSIPLGNVVLGGSGANRTVTVTSGAATGATTITLTVSDADGGTAQTSFVVTVFANSAPQITSPITFSSVTINQNGTTGPIPFSIADVNSPASSLTVSGSSDNQTRVPNANITFSGTDSARTNFVTPAPGQFGTVQITITVSDGEATTSKSYNLTINALPVLTITSPANNSTTNFPAVITVAGTSSDPDGILGPVVYYMNESPVRTNSGSPFSFTLTNLAAGSYGFKSVATDNRSASSTSSVATVTINPFTITPPVITTTQAQFTYAANPGLKYIVQGSADLKQWTDIVTNTATTSSESFTDTGISGQTFKFYRVIQAP